MTKKIFAYLLLSKRVFVTFGNLAQLILENVRAFFELRIRFPQFLYLKVEKLFYKALLQQKAMLTDRISAHTNSHKTYRKKQTKNLTSEFLDANNCSSSATRFFATLNSVTGSVTSCVDSFNTSVVNSVNWFLIDDNVDKPVLKNRLILYRLT